MKLVVDNSRRTDEQPFYMDRINRLKKRLLSTRPEMDLENARILTKGFKESEGLPLVLRKAKAFLKQCREKSVTIWDTKPVGQGGASAVAGGYVHSACSRNASRVVEDYLLYLLLLMEPGS